MAYDATGLSLVRRLQNSLSQWAYVSAVDDPTAQAAVGYFNGAADQMRVGDILDTYAAGTPSMFAVTGNTGSVVTVAPLPTPSSSGTINNDDWLGTDLAINNGGTGASDASTARTNLGLGTLATANTVNGSNWSGQDLALVDGGTGASDAAGARSNLGLGALATQALVDNADWDAAGADLAVANGGTGASDASTARTNLGLGTLATASTINNDNWSGTDLTIPNGGTGASNATAARSNLGIGTLGTLETVSNDQWTVGGTDLTIANGGTGASDAATARTNLGIGAGSESAAGILELAVVGEVNPGTDNTRAVSPDSLAGSYAGTKEYSLQLTALPTHDMVVGDGAAAFLVTACVNGMNLVSVLMVVHTAGTTGTTDVQVRRRRAGADSDMLSTKVTIDSTETSSATAAAAAVINASFDDVQTGDIIYADIDAVSTTAPKGGILGLEFRLP